MAERVEKSWGYEEIIHNDRYCTKLLVYTKKIASSLHYHKKKHEIFIIHEGEFEIETIGLKKIYHAGDYLVLPPNSPHRVRCLELGSIIETSSHDDPKDCVRLVPSET